MLGCVERDIGDADGIPGCGLVLTRRLEGIHGRCVVGKLLVRDIAVEGGEIERRLASRPAIVGTGDSIEDALAGVIGRGARTVVRRGCADRGWDVRGADACRGFGGRRLGRRLGWLALVDVWPDERDAQSGM
jgi:hypothetical protein